MKRDLRIPWPLKLLANVAWWPIFFPPQYDVVAAAPIPLILLAVSLAGAAVSAIGQIQQGKAAKAVAERQASESNVRAQYALQAGEENARRVRRQAEYRTSERIASLGGSGVTLEGSPLAVMMAERTQFELSALDELQKGKVEARGETAQAGIHTFSGKQAEKASYFGAGTTILSGAGSALGSYWQGTR